MSYRLRQWLKATLAPLDPLFRHALKVILSSAIVRGTSELFPDFSVVLFRPNFILVSEEYPVKTHKNQWLLNLLSPPAFLCGAANQGTHHGVWSADAFAGT